MLLLEVDELKEAYEREEVDMIDLESEVGDIFYLLIRLALSTGIDPIEAIIAKVARNYRKYVGQESREVAKERWSKEQDHAFLSQFYNNYREKIGS
jgi:NTP pyrophosphatase (non-canonical NTP hydrolase)